ncbi:hypothetical protein TKK_0004885 [Trichogramma kaykai]|uniref:Alpha-carbonic anhydrase domain-containing protein n=1 Tax=Trichogramma kaykai TaxID=54128 RepID=A0ABD2XIP0_9HYME
MKATFKSYLDLYGLYAETSEFDEDAAAPIAGTSKSLGGASKPVAGTSASKEGASRPVAGTSGSNGASPVATECEESFFEEPSFSFSAASGDGLSPWRRFATAWKSRFGLDSPDLENNLTGVITLKNYEQRVRKFTITNDIYIITPCLKYRESKEPRIIGSSHLFPGESFVFCDMDLYWCQDDYNRGHFAGKTYDVEVHLIHYNRKYNSVEQAVIHPDGILVFAIPFVNANKGSSNKGIKKMTKYFLKVAMASTNNSYKTWFSLMNLAMFVSNPVEAVYHYEAPLVIGGEILKSANWIVLPEPKNISERHISTLRKVWQLNYQENMQNYLKLHYHRVTENDLRSI